MCLCFFFLSVHVERCQKKHRDHQVLKCSLIFHKLLLLNILKHAGCVWDKQHFIKTHVANVCKRAVGIAQNVRVKNEKKCIGNVCLQHCLDAEWMLNGTCLI